MSEQNQKAINTASDVRNRMIALRGMVHNAMNSTQAIDMVCRVKLQDVESDPSLKTVSMEVPALQLLDEQVKIVMTILTGLSQHYTANIEALSPSVIGAVQSLQDSTKAAATAAGVAQPAPVRPSLSMAPRAPAPAPKPVEPPPAPAASPVQQATEHLSLLEQIQQQQIDAGAAAKHLHEQVLKNMAMPELAEVVPSIARVCCGMEEHDRKVLETARVPNSPHAQLEYPSASPMARYFFRDGTYQQRAEFERIHEDIYALPREEWITLREGAYGPKDCIDSVDTPNAIMVRMDDAGIAVLWNPILNTYSIFHMDLNRREDQECGFVHRWIHHKGMSTSYIQNTLNNLNLRLGFAK